MMMTLLVFGFFSAATEELKSSTYYGSSLKTRQLTDVVTNMVIAQIRKATAEQKSEGQRYTWVSQPGCITTFTNRGSDYNTLAVAKYKLYSSETMEQVSEDNLVDDINDEWDKKPHHYVDLNAPLYSERENELYFPPLYPGSIYMRFKGLYIKHDLNEISSGLVPALNQTNLPSKPAKKKKKNFQWKQQTLHKTSFIVR